MRYELVFLGVCAMADLQAQTTGSGPCHAQFSQDCPAECAKLSDLSQDAACAGCLADVCTNSSATTACQGTETAMGLCGAILTPTLAQLCGCADCLDHALQANPDKDPNQPCNIYLYGTCGAARNRANPEAAQSLTNACQNAFATVTDPVERADRAHDCVATCYPQVITAHGTFINDPVYITKPDGSQIIDQTGATICIKTIKTLKSFATQTNLTDFSSADLTGGDFTLMNFNSLTAYAPLCPQPTLLYGTATSGNPLNFSGAKAQYVDFSSRDFTASAKTKFDGADFSHALFISSNIPGASAINSTFDGASFQMATIDNLTFDNTQASGLSAGGATITNTVIRNNSKVANGDFTGASMGNVIIDNSTAAGSIFTLITPAVAYSADGSATPYPSVLTAQNNANLDMAKFNSAKLGNGALNIKNSSAKTSIWAGAQMDHAQLQDGDFSSATFDNADATGSAFKGTFFGTYFGGTKLTNVIVDLNGYNGFNSLWFAKNIDQAIDTATITSVNPAGEVYNTDLYNKILGAIGS